MHTCLSPRATPRVAQNPKPQEFGLQGWAGEDPAVRATPADLQLPRQGGLRLLPASADPKAFLGSTKGDKGEESWSVTSNNGEDT